MGGGKTIRVLLVEDSEHDWLAFRRACQGMTCAVTRCARAEGALTLLDEVWGNKDADSQVVAVPFDLVVTDYKLPGMSGLDLCAEFLAREFPAPLVLLTGAGSEHLAVEALKMGVSDYIVKDPNQGYLALLPVVFPEVVRRYEDRLARKRAEAALIIHNRRLALLTQVGQDLTAMLDVQGVVDRLLYAVIETLDAEGCSLWLTQAGSIEDGESSEPRHLVCRGFCDIRQGCGVPEALSIPFGKGCVGWVARHGKSIVVNDVDNDPRFYPGVDAITGLKTRSLLAVHIHNRQRHIGVLEIVNKLKGTFDADLRFMETLAISAGIALDNAQLVETLRERNEELEAALGAIKTLSGLVPICAWCGSKIQDDEGNWVKVESYIEAHSEAEFTHGICPDCLPKLRKK